MAEEAPFPTSFKLSNVPTDWKDMELHEVCGPYGTLKRSMIWRDLRTGGSKGWALIEYATSSEAKKAAAELDGQKPPGSQTAFKVDVKTSSVAAQPASPAKIEAVASSGSEASPARSDAPPNTNMQVRHIPRAWDNTMLKSQCEKFGKVKRATVWRSWKTQKSKGYGLVEFETIEESEAAMQGLSGTTFPTVPKACQCVYSYPKGDERRPNKK